MIRLTAEERANLHETLKRFTLGKGQIRILLDSLDVAENESVLRHCETESERIRGDHWCDRAHELETEVARLQTLHAGRNDFLGVLFQEMTMLLEGDCAEPKARCAINRWCGLFESLGGED